MLASATPTSYEPPAFVANPVEHVDTLIGTGNGGQTVGEINNFPGASVPFGHGAVFAGDRRQLCRLCSPKQI